MQTHISLQPGVLYHIFNRGERRENLFIEERDFRYFVQLYAHRIFPVADTFAYCLMHDHFHLLVRIKSEEEYLQGLHARGQESAPGGGYHPSQHFSGLFHEYLKTVRREPAEGVARMPAALCCMALPPGARPTHLIHYIHFNPQKHHLVDDFRRWHWSSYSALEVASTGSLRRDEVMEWFGGVERYTEFHRGALDEAAVAALVEGDDDA